MRCISIVWLVLLSISNGDVHAAKGDSLSVIGVHRSLELDGRRVHSGRQVFLGRQAERPIKVTVGDVLTVYRQESLSLASGHSTLDFAEEMPAFKRAQRNVVNEAYERLPRDKIRRGGRVSLRPSNDLGETDNGRPAGFANSRRQLVPSDRALESSLGELRIGDDTSIQLRVGTIRIVKVLEHIVIGEVLEDGLKPGEGGHGEELTAIAIMAGDVAKPDENLTVRERAKTHAKPMNLDRLKKERDRLIDAAKQLKRKSKPFTRPNMQWRL